MSCNAGVEVAMADRIEREIEEILRKIDDFVPERSRRQARKVGQPLSSAQGWLSRRLARISLNQVMIWSIFVLLVSFFLREIPGVYWVMIGALVVLVTAFIFSRRAGTGARPSVQKRWRGQPIDLSGPGFADRMKSWIKGRRRA
jgi:hypothetical protein